MRRPEDEVVMEFFRRLWDELCHKVLIPCPTLHLNHWHRRKPVARLGETQIASDCVRCELIIHAWRMHFFRSFSPDRGLRVRGEITRRRQRNDTLASVCLSRNPLKEQRCRLR
ncbi:hypothetical protein DPEC_G00112220 [Dallia pectoralis]|uniref:Uncharacterized protein n=1 Tax=Dallia pectoralis TaxID=75939 RepID=A0ACC2GTY7_DALPE|nr:hypothetical protein DPEC_G00112220 [Dallia pectoralis]